MLYRFEPNFNIVAEFDGLATIENLEKEAGVYSATPRFVRDNCGDVARHLLDLVPDSYYAEAESLKLWPNCDVRIHRLYPGDFPAYPGWHCDGEFRETYFSQPDLNRIPVSHHLTATVSSCREGVSCTQFLAEPVQVAIDESTIDQEHTLWGKVDGIVEEIRPKRLHDICDGQLVRFDSWTLHRAMPARIRGWRLFFRMSMWHRPNLGEGGMRTKQEQVYKIVEGGGW